MQRTRPTLSSPSQPLPAPQHPSTLLPRLLPPHPSSLLEQNTQTVYDFCLEQIQNTKQLTIFKARLHIPLLASPPLPIALPNGFPSSYPRFPNRFPALPPPIPLPLPLPLPLALSPPDLLHLYHRHLTSPTCTITTPPLPLSSITVLAILLFYHHPTFTTCTITTPPQPLTLTCTRRARAPPPAATTSSPISFP